MMIDSFAVTGHGRRRVLLNDSLSRGDRGMVIEVFSVTTA